MRKTKFFRSFLLVLSPFAFPPKWVAIFLMMAPNKSLNRTQNTYSLKYSTKSRLFIFNVKHARNNPPISSISLSITKDYIKSWYQFKKQRKPTVLI